MHIHSFLEILSNHPLYIESQREIVDPYFSHLYIVVWKEGK